MHIQRRHKIISHLNILPNSNQLKIFWVISQELRWVHLAKPVETKKSNEVSHTFKFEYLSEFVTEIVAYQEPRCVHPARPVYNKSLMQDKFDPKTWLPKQF
jgi:hypothetical protein